MDNNNIFNQEREFNPPLPEQLKTVLLASAENNKTLDPDTQMPQIILTGSVARTIRDTAESTKDEVIELNDKHIQHVHDIDVVTTGNYKTRQGFSDAVRDLPDVQENFPTQGFYYDQSVADLVYKRYDIQYHDTLYTQIPITTLEAELVVTVSEMGDSDSEKDKIRRKILEMTSSDQLDLDAFKKLSSSYVKSAHNLIRSNFYTFTLKDIIKTADKQGLPYNEALAVLNDKEEYMPKVDYAKFSADLKNCKSQDDVLQINYEDIKVPTVVEEFLFELEGNSLRR